MNQPEIFKPFNKLSVSKKLTVLFLMFSMVVIILMTTVQITVGLSDARNELDIQNQSLATMIGQSSIAALDFDDINRAEVNISSLGEIENIVLGCMFNRGGRLYVSYDNSQKYSCPDQFTNDSLTLISDSDLIGQMVEISDDLEVYGWVYVASDESHINDKIVKQVLISFLLAIIVLGLSLILANIARRYVSSPIERITTVAREIRSSSGGSKIRASVKTNDEIGLLSDSFNQMLDSLEVKNNQQNQILQSMIIGIVTLNERGRIIRANAAAEKLFKFDEDQMVGHTIKHLIDEVTDINMHQFIDNHLNKSSLLQNEDIIARTKTDDLFPVKFSLIEIPSTDKMERRLIATFFDMSLIREQEETIRRTQKMDALGSLTGGVAHDFNNILGIIIGYSELVMYKLGDEHILYRQISEIHNAGKRGAKLSQKLLAFTRQKVSDRKQVNLNDLINDDQNMIEKLLTARIKLSTVLDQDLWNVRLDENEFADALLNMSINAMHAIESEGDIILTTSNYSLNTTEAKRLNLPIGDYVLFRIADNGIGMDKRTQERIFDPFYSTKGDSGTGLGLSQVYGFVSRCHGSITVESVLNKGTTFSLLFPKYDDALKNEDERDEKTIELISHDENDCVLIVDDEMGVADLTTQSLKLRGYQVFTTYDAEAALDILARHKIDILITDIIMPKMSGYELARIAMAKYPDMDILMISGYPGERPIDEVIPELSDNILQKPFELDTLLIKLREIRRAKSPPKVIDS